MCVCMQSHTLPPWVLLDLDSQRHTVTDLQTSFQQQHAPMPALNSNDIIHRAMGEWYSFYLRKPLPDMPSGGSVDISAAESANTVPAMTVASANETISKLMRAKLAPNHGFRPITLPQDVVQQMVDGEATAADGWFEVGGPAGSQTCAVLHLPVGQGDDMLVHHALVQTPVAASQQPNASAQGRTAANAPARDGSPALVRQAATKRKRAAGEVPESESALLGFAGGKAARGAARAAGSMSRGLASGREEESSVLWRDQPRGTNPVAFLFQRAEAKNVDVQFEDRAANGKDGSASGAWIRVDIFWGEVRQPIGSASGVHSLTQGHALPVVLCALVFGLCT